MLHAGTAGMAHAESHEVVLKQWQVLRFYVFSTTF